MFPTPAEPFLSIDPSSRLRPASDEEHQTAATLAGLALGLDAVALAVDLAAGGAPAFVALAVAVVAAFACFFSVVALALAWVFGRRVRWLNILAVVLLGAGVLAMTAGLSVWFVLDHL
jgi:hypothetical protein